MIKRNETKQIMVGNLPLGHQNRVLIQSMCDIKTSDYEAVASQINRCAALGADYMRVSIEDEDDAKAIPQIKNRISIPLVADIHYDYRLALLAMEGGIDKIRINPGNIGSKEKVQAVVSKAKELHIPIRIGVNGGSLEHEFATDEDKALALYKSALKAVAEVESCGYDDICISLKDSSPLVTLKAYELMAESSHYPLHLGLTEAGPLESSLIKSSAILGKLLLDGIGDTIRISISAAPEVEITAAKKLLNFLGLAKNMVTVISCPTCGRTTIDVKGLALEIEKKLEYVNKPLKVAVMGCPVNGVGEGKDADIGIAGSKSDFIIFKKGHVIARLQKVEGLRRLYDEIDELIKSN